VQPTQYPISKKRVTKKLPPAPEPLPPFNPLLIHNKHKYKPNLPDHINNKDPWQLFKLFWTDELLNKLVKYTNKNTELHPPPEDAQFPHRWKPTSKQELYVYLAVLIHIGLHIESSIEDYWHKDSRHGTIHIIRKYIGANRWQQIDRYFYCTQLKSKDNAAFQNTFKRIQELSKELWLASIKFYKPRIHFTVNETIKHFTGHTPEIINIPTKPTPKGFKIWMSGNQSYILNWIFHAKGDNKGPVDLDKY